MHVLLVTHRYPPDGTAGAETYAATLAGHFERRGVEVSVLTAVKDIARRHLSVHRRIEGRTPVVEVVNNLFATDFRTTWDEPLVDAIAGELLDELRPDVVHVHHLLYLSVGILRACREREIPVLMVLHDFWLGCARFGQLLHADGARCDAVDPARCGTCLPSFPWRQSDAARRVGRGVAALKSVTGLDLSGPLSRRHRKSAGGVAGVASPPPAEAEAFAALAEDRLEEIVRAVNDARPRVLLPARFQAKWFEAHGVAEELLVHQPTGLDWDEAQAEPRVDREPGEALRVLMLGTLVPHKGAHVLVDAWGRIDEERRGRARLRIHGPADSRPAYVEELRRAAGRVGVTIGERLDRRGVAQALAASDLLVVPSLWLEVRPLVMMEAHAAGVRILCSDLGGMAEVIADGAAGSTFPAGDADALARALEAEIDRAAEALPPRPEPTAAFPRWDAVADAFLRHSAELAAEGPAVDPPGPRS